MYLSHRLPNGNEHTCKFLLTFHEKVIPAESYSDYRGLKKRITAIRSTQEQDGSTPLLPAELSVDTHTVYPPLRLSEGEDQLTLSPSASLTEEEQSGYEQDKELARHDDQPNVEVCTLTIPDTRCNLFRGNRNDVEQPRGPSFDRQQSH